MRTRQSAIWGLGLVVAAAFAINASAQSDTKPAGTAGTSPDAAKVPVGISPSLSRPAASLEAPVAKAAPRAVSPWYTEVVKMTQAGVGPEPIFAYIDSAGTFNLDAEEIIYLHDLGAPSGLIMAMIQHDTDISLGVLPLPVTAVPKLPPLAKTASAATNAAPAVTLAKPVATTPPAPATEPEPEEDYFGDYLPPYDDPPPPPGFSPVRKPYAVQLLDPIVIVRAPERIANVISIQVP